MSVFHENMLIGSSGQGGATAYSISRSLRFNSADSAYLSRTPASASNRKTWTWAGWVKRSGLTNYMSLFHGRNDNTNQTALLFWDDDTLVYRMEGGGTVNDLKTTQVFRDISSWYHIVVAVDTTQATSSNRTKLYVNGQQITSFSTASYQTQNGDTFINSTFAHAIGANPNVVNLFSGYLADIYFIDGQALDPTSFGEFSTTTGVWNPKAYTGSYGTNGFHLEFADNSNNTATTLGKDTSGNGNNFTPTNLSVTAGAGNDSLIDVPTNGSQTDTGVGNEVRGNYCTLNPLDKSADYTLQNGNLDLTTNGSNSWEMVRATFAVSSGKWYWEFTAGDNETALGIAKASAGLANYIGSDANGWSYFYSGDKYNNSSNTAYGAAFTTNDVIGVAFDADAGSLYFYKNGTVQNSGTAAFTGLTSGPYFPGFSIRDSGSTSVVNFGQRAFAYTAPSGFKALCDTNLTAPVIAKPNTVMDVALWTGNNSSGRSITGLNFSPDFVWIKSRSNNGAHAWFDALRSTNMLASNETGAESSYGNPPVGGYVSAFNSNGFTLTNGSVNNTYVNENNYTYAGWCWDAGTSTVTNTQGSITSSVRANATAGFSIVTYTGNGSSSQSIGHGLGVAPKMVIIKNRNGSPSYPSWYVRHESMASNHNARLELTEKTYSTTTEFFQGGIANLTSSTVVSFNTGTNAGGSGGGNGNVNTSGVDYVAYCFAPVTGMNAFGSYTGNGSTDGPFVWTGHRVRWLMIKRTDTAGYDWFVIDTARSTYNTADNYLAPNSSTSENGFGAATFFDILSNGFKLRTDGASRNASGGTYIYAAFAESPFNYARAR